MRTDERRSALLCHGGKVQQLLSVCADPKRSGARGTLANPERSQCDCDWWHHSLPAVEVSRPKPVYANPEISVPEPERRHLLSLNVHPTTPIWPSLEFYSERRRIFGTQSRGKVPFEILKALTSVQTNCCLLRLWARCVRGGTAVETACAGCLVFWQLRRWWKDSRKLATTWDPSGPPALSDVSEGPFTAANMLTYLATQVNLSLSWRIEM